MPETIAQSSSENYNKSVGTSAVVLAKGGGLRHSGSGVITVGGTINMPRYITVHNNHVSQTLYLGWGSDVSTSNGLPVPAGEYRTLRVWYDDELWAIASGAATDARVYVLHGKGNPTFDVLDLSPTAWFDASDESTITDTGGAVDTWADKSGNGYDVTQATAANKPTTGTRTMNGLNVLDFDGSSDYLQGAFGVTLSQPNTIFAVFHNDAASPADYIYDGDDGTNRHAFYLSSNKYNLFAGDNPNGGTIDTDPHISRAVFNRADSSLFIDGSSVCTGSVGTQSMDGITVGARNNGANFLDGAIAEIAVFDGALTAQQIADTETYLANKWGISI